jgi:alkylation response protein AidB-like acyl-CoA dehydrogenase
VVSGQIDSPSGAPDAEERGIRERIAMLEYDFGDLDDPGNPLSSEQFLAADARRIPLNAAELLLDAFELNAEFVPRELGGRLTRMDTMARVMRAVFRRDAALGLGYGMTSYQAAAIVWAAGSASQQRDTAQLLLDGGRLTSAYPEPHHGNAFLANNFTAEPGPEGYLLSGRKEAVNNAARAEYLVAFAHTPPGPGGADDALSAFLLALPVNPRGGIRQLPRRSTTGVRGCLVSGLEFTRFPVRADQLLGAEGDGRSLAAQVFPVTRSTGASRW